MVDRIKVFPTVVFKFSKFYEVEWSGINQTLVFFIEINKAELRSYQIRENILQNFWFFSGVNFLSNFRK